MWLRSLKRSGAEEREVLGFLDVCVWDIASVGCHITTLAGCSIFMSPNGVVPLVETSGRGGCTRGVLLWGSHPHPRQRIRPC